MSRIPRRIAGLGASDLLNTAAFDAYVGPAREITVDQERGIIALHDGVTPGGHRFRKDAGDLFSTNNLSDLLDASTARDNLGLGDAAILNAPDDADLNNFPTDLALRRNVKTYADIISLADVCPTKAALGALDVGRYNTAYLAIEGREGRFGRRLISSLSTSEAAARAADVNSDFFITSTDDPAYCWMRVDNQVWAHWFGCVGDDATDNSTNAQIFISVATKLGYALRWAAGIYRFYTQLVVTGGAGVRLKLIMTGAGPDQTIFKSYVTGSVLGVATAGFLILFDGCRFSAIGGMTVDYTNGNGGYVGRCRNESFYKNRFENLRFIGGDPSGTARQVNDRRSFKIIGNEPEANSTGYVSYFNIIEDASYNVAYTHVEFIDGGGAAATREANVNSVGRNSLFERYIIAINLNNNDECTVDGGRIFFQQGQGVAGVNGGETWCVRSDGIYNLLNFECEPGTGSRPYYLDINAVRNVVNVMSNSVLAGLDVSTAQNNVVTTQTNRLGNFLFNTANSNPAQNNVIGSALRTNGTGEFSSAAPALQLNRTVADGEVAVMRRAGVIVGSIGVTTTATAYNTASDKTLKIDDGVLDFDRAWAVLKLMEFHRFRWVSNGEEDTGVFAQDLFDVYPRAVSVGGWRDVDGEPIYTPWGVDYSKLIPILGACVQGLMARLPR